MGVLSIFVIRARSCVPEVFCPGGVTPDKAHGSMTTCGQSIVDSPLFVYACFVDTPVCVLHSGCLNDNW